MKKYLSAVKDLGSLREREIELRKVIDETFVQHFKETFPDEFEILEKHLDGNIDKIVSLRYKHNDTGEWADFVLVSTDNISEKLDDGREYYSFQLPNTSDYWDRDAVSESIVSDDLPSDVVDVLRHIYREFPYTNEEEV